MKRSNFIYFSNTLIFKEKRNKILSLRNIILFLIFLSIFFYFSRSKTKKPILKEKKSNFTSTEKNINNNNDENLCYPINLYMNITQCFTFIIPNELSLIFKIDNQNISIGNYFEEFLKNPIIEINNRKCFSDHLMFKIYDLKHLNCVEIEQNKDDRIPFMMSFSLYIIKKETVHLFPFKEVNVSYKIQNDDILIYDNKIRFCNISQSDLPNFDSLLEITWNVTQQNYFCMNNLYFIY